MLSEDDLWKALEQLHRNDTPVDSLTMKSGHKIVSISPASRRYKIEITGSGGEHDVDFWKICKMYSMLTEHGRLFNSDMKEYGYKEIDMTEWHAPGSAMLAVLPLLDFRIRIHEGGNEAGLYYH